MKLKPAFVSRPATCTCVQEESLISGAQVMAGLVFAVHIGWLCVFMLSTTARAQSEHPPSQTDWQGQDSISRETTRQESAGERLKRAFSVPAIYQDDFGDLRLPLMFADSSRAETKAQWSKRRTQILTEWQRMLGPWPELMTQPVYQVLKAESNWQPGITRLTLKFKWTPNDWTEAYLLLPETREAAPAVITVYYEPETSIGEGKPYRDFGLQLARRGFVILSLGTREATADKTYALYYPSLEAAEVQPLSMLAYAAANGWHLLAARPEVDATRIGIVGHSFGGKWAMFASCLFDKFGCAVWSDPGIVFDETRPNVNYWEPWYLGYHPPPWRERGMITQTNPARGLYPELVEAGHDLHELHTLMAPRPFLVSGGSEDPPGRWTALNHTRSVNHILGFKHRVAMDNRSKHAPNADSNAVIYAFFEKFLKDNRADQQP